ncbi:MAG: hypothetical protein M3546_13165 [Actinomycetota bacterium]|nr:hypothetical protein [Actinomycetota bacterium]
MEKTRNWAVSPAAIVRVALVVFVLAWIFGPYELRSAVPVLIVFLIALGLELNFLVGALRGTRAPRPDRKPQDVDRERYGYEHETDDLVLVRRGGEEIWIPYSGESADELEELIANADSSPEETDESAFEPEHGSALAPVRQFLVGLGLIGALGLMIWFVESRTGWDALDGSTRLEAVERFSEEASRIADKPVSIYCDESRDFVGAVQHADGVAEVGGERAYLTPEICLDLYRLAFRDEVRGSQTGRAIAVLAHEAWHLRGVGDEGATECYAVQSGVEIGGRLGLSEERARQLMRQQLAENALRGGSSVEYRVPPECREGGRLDLAPVSTGFP